MGELCLGLPGHPRCAAQRRTAFNPPGPTRKSRSNSPSLRAYSTTPTATSRSRSPPVNGGTTSSSLEATSRSFGRRTINLQAVSRSASPRCGASPKPGTGIASIRRSVPGRSTQRNVCSRASASRTRTGNSEPDLRACPGDERSSSPCPLKQPARSCRSAPRSSRRWVRDNAPLDPLLDTHISGKCAAFETDRPAA